MSVCGKMEQMCGKINPPILPSREEYYLRKAIERLSKLKNQNKPLLTLNMLKLATSCMVVLASAQAIKVTETDSPALLLA